MLPIEQVPTAAFGLTLAVSAHKPGWPLPRGGAQQISNALAAYLRSAGRRDRHRAARHCPLDLPHTASPCSISRPASSWPSAAIVFSSRYRRQLDRLSLRRRRFQDGLGARRAHPVDGAEECNRAATVHLGGTMAEIAASERAVAEGDPSDRPYVLLVQHSLFDPSACPCRQSHRLGLLPCAQRLDHRHDRAHREPDRALCPRLPRASSSSAASCRRRRWSATTPTTSAATSTAACRTSGSCTPGRPRVLTPTPPRQGHLHLLVIHAAWRRRARHVRLLRRQNCVA